MAIYQLIVLIALISKAAVLTKMVKAINPKESGKYYTDPPPSISYMCMPRKLDWLYTTGTKL
jgi:hypothetical protein